MTRAFTVSRRKTLAIVLPAVTFTFLLAGLVLANTATSPPGSPDLTAAVMAVLLAVAAGWIIARATGAAKDRVNPSSPLATAGDSSVATRQVSQRLVAIQESVRREMADYLHGHVQSKLLALSMSLTMCRQQMEEDPEAASRALENIQLELKKVQEEDMGQVSYELYPSIIKMGLAPAIRSLVSRFSNLIEIDLSIDPRVPDLDRAGEAIFPEGRRLGVYRIAEEAMSNAMKHAEASKLEVRLACSGPNQLVLSVVDNGHGFDSTKMAPGQGLAAMVDYAETIGGRARITSVGGRGTTVNVSVAIPGQAPFDS